MVTTTDLVSYYKFDEASGNAADAHGSNTSTTSNVTYGETGKLDDAFGFNGGSSYVDTNYNISSGDFTINFWAAATTAPDSMMLAGNGNNSTGWYVYFAGTTNFNIRNGSSNNFLGSRPISDANYHMYCFTYDGTTFKVYIDNTLEHSATITLNYGSSDFFVGNWPAASLAWDGDICEVAIFDAEISSSDRADLYNSGSGLAYPFSTGTGIQLNIGDVWKAVSAMKINIGDVWKDVAGAQINIGDTWKTIF